MVEYKINNLFKKIERLIFYGVIKIDILNIIIGIKLILLLFYDKKDSKYYSFIKSVFNVIIYIRLFNVLFKKFIESYIVKIGITTMKIINNEISNPNSEVAPIIRDLYSELE